MSPVAGSVAKDTKTAHSPPACGGGRGKVTEMASGQTSTRFFTSASRYGLSDVQPRGGLFSMDRPFMACVNRSAPVSTRPSRLIGDTLLSLCCNSVAS